VLGNYVGRGDALIFRIKRCRFAGERQYDSKVMINDNLNLVDITSGTSLVINGNTTIPISKAWFSEALRIAAQHKFSGLIFVELKIACNHSA
jgi:hypothetical protein